MVNQKFLGYKWNGFFCRYFSYWLIGRRNLTSNLYWLFISQQPIGRFQNRKKHLRKKRFHFYRRKFLFTSGIFSYLSKTTFVTPTIWWVVISGRYRHSPSNVITFNIPTRRRNPDRHPWNNNFIISRGHGYIRWWCTWRLGLNHNAGGNGWPILCAIWIFEVK